MILEGVIKEVTEKQRMLLENKDTGLKRAFEPATRNLSSHALIISGIRRCGKSTLLLQMMQLMNKEDFFFLNFDTPQLYGFNARAFSRLDKVIGDTTARLLFFDEMQLVEGWEMYVRQKLDESFQVIVTGSNATMLGKELGTRLTGRHVTQELFPFSYTEFLSFRALSPGRESLTSYMTLGGFPEFLKSEAPEQLLMLYDDILMRDIVARHGIKDTVSLKRLANYLLANIGNRISATKLKQPLSIGATSTVLSWMSYLEHSYLFGFLPMFSYSSKAQLINPRKVYAIDTGLVQAMSVSKTEDRGRKLENLVYLHLRRKYRELYYFNNSGECDFVVFENGTPKELIQICCELTPDNVDREVAGLTEAMKFFNFETGQIVTFDDKDKIEEDGLKIEVVPAHEYLNLK